MSYYWESNLNKSTVSVVEECLYQGCTIEATFISQLLVISHLIVQDIVVCKPIVW